MTPRARQRTLLLGVLAAVAFALVLFSRREREERESLGSSSTSASSQRQKAQMPVSADVPFDRTNARERFVGSSVCAPCHQVQAAAFAKSHHALALVPASPDALEAQLAQATFSSPLGGKTRFAASDGKVQVTTPGAHGRPATFPLVYTSGVWPLEQYVVAAERGKLQSLGVVWDSRAKSEGGERWLHVYGPRGIAHDDPLYFTGSAQNWNHVCADCHSTFVERRYDVEKDAFDTRWAELSVGCEACHGPGAEHVRAAKAYASGSAWSGQRGLSVALKSAAPWAPSATGSPAPRPLDSVQSEVCAPCHSRREPLHEAFLAGDPFLDAFEPELLLPGRYHADGQVEGEVYEWASFLQSKMHASGVRCSDCHEPHSAKLYAPGNALCSRCHAPARFDQPSHSHHTGDKAPLCVDCHMPPATFMQIDERRDHSIRVPRPDHSVKFGTPNACTGCHTQKNAAWAAEWVARWSPSLAARPHFVEALGRDRLGALDAPRALNELGRDSKAPSVARATALQVLAGYPSPKAIETLRGALANGDALVVYGAVLGAEDLPLRERASLLLPVLGHQVRAVRVAAGKALAGLPLAELDARARASLERAFAEVEASFGVSASRPESHVERSAFELARGNVARAEQALGTALRLAPCLAEAHLNLADLERARGDEAAAEKAIREALRCAPENAFAHHALGLLLVRKKALALALASLRKAVELAPAETRFAYVLAVALAESGDVTAAVKTLELALSRRPNAAELLEALQAFESRLGHVEAAAEAQQKLAKLRE